MDAEQWRKIKQLYGMKDLLERSLDLLYQLIDYKRFVFVPSGAADRFNSRS
jgi:hypothetical protein